MKLLICNFLLSCLPKRRICIFIKIVDRAVRKYSHAVFSEHVVHSKAAPNPFSFLAFILSLPHTDETKTKNWLATRFATLWRGLQARTRTRYLTITTHDNVYIYLRFV